jgi:hypothetical protein
VDGQRQRKIRRIEREFHSYFKEYDSFSNDGVFVWSDIKSSNKQYEDKESATNADTSWQLEKYSLTDFIKQTTQYSGTVLLWRPAYNLFDKTVEKDNRVSFTKTNYRTRKTN